MLTDGVYKVNFNPFFPTHTHPRRNVRNWEEKQHLTLSLVSAIPPFLCLGTQVSIFYFLPNVYVL